MQPTQSFFLLLWIFDDFEVRLEEHQGKSLCAVLLFVGCVFCFGFEIYLGTLGQVFLHEVDLVWRKAGDVEPRDRFTGLRLGIDRNGVLEVLFARGGGLLLEVGTDSANQGHLGKPRLEGGGERSY